MLDVLTGHYSSPGKLADYKRRFERVSREPGSETSVFAVELETLALRAFKDLSLSARLQLVHDRFIPGQRECSLHRHLDSMDPGTSIRDIVDRCRVWESHAGFTDCRGDQPSPKRPLPVYMIDEVGTEDSQLELAPDVSSEDQDMLGSLMRHLLPTPVMSPPRATPIPSERDQLIQRLLGNEHPVQPLLQERSSFTDMEILLQFASGRFSSDGAATADGTPQQVDSGGFFLLVHDWFHNKCKSFSN